MERLEPQNNFKTNSNPGVTLEPFLPEIWDEVPTKINQPRPETRAVPVFATFVGIGLLAFLLRMGWSWQQSAYMDESTFILTGRMLIEQNAIYAGALNWTYGSYLWSLLAGSADIIGGLLLMRTLVAFFGAVMTMATMGVAWKVTPQSYSPQRRLIVTVLAGLTMALFPTAIALGRFGTYDSLAGAAFFTGIALLFPVRPTGQRRAMLAAAALFFIAFLSKYVVAVFFPFVCLYLLFSVRRPYTLVRNLAYFILPLSTACLTYFLIFHKELFGLLSYGIGYTDLRSDNPLREYLWQRPEIWLLAFTAAFGLHWASRTGRMVALAGSAIILGFQVVTRSDYDFWKHSIYLIFFFAPLAALSLTPVAEYILAHTTGAKGGAKRRQGWLKLGLVGLVLLVVPTIFSMLNANNLVTFYPNLNASLEAIKKEKAAKKVLVDDIAVRYYLYPQVPTEMVVDPFFVDYKGKQGMDGYTLAISDRYYDSIILDGGVGPVARQIKEQLEDLILHYYEPVYTNQTGSGTLVEIYHPRQGELKPFNPQDLGTTKVYYFDNSVRGWGGHPESGQLQPGLQTSINLNTKWKEHGTLQFKVTNETSLLAVRRTGPVKKVTMQVYIAGPKGSTPVRVGMIGFDSGWNWHDDGFEKMITPGEWTEMVWEIPDQRNFNEIGLKFNDAAGQTVYVGKVEME